MRLYESIVNTLKEGEIVYTKQVSCGDDAIMFPEEVSDYEAILQFVKDYAPAGTKPEQCTVTHFDKPIRSGLNSDGSLIDPKDRELIEEKANPENAKANELIKKALESKADALKLAPKLEKYGIKVTKSEELDYNELPREVYLVGPNGRKLKPETYPSNWDKGNYDARDITPDNKAFHGEDSIYNEETGEYTHYVDHSKDNTLGTKSYNFYREKVKTAKAELPVFKKRLNLYARRYGENSKQYRDLKDAIKQHERTLANGIQAMSGNQLSPDIDYKNYLDKPFVSDRPKAGDELVRKDKWYSNKLVNKTVADYKDAKEGLGYVARTREENLRRDQEDQERIKRYQDDAAAEKLRRDTIADKDEKFHTDRLKSIQDRIADLKKKHNIK